MLPAARCSSTPPSASAESTSAPSVQTALITPRTSNGFQARPPPALNPANSIHGVGMTPLSAARIPVIRPTANTVLKAIGSSVPTNGTIELNVSSTRLRKLSASSATGCRRNSAKPLATQRQPLREGRTRTCIDQPWSGGAP